MKNYNIPEFTVAEFSRNLKRIIEDNFGYVRIRGEISGLKKASSGHLYFSLKDEKAIISAVCFKNMADLISFEINDGLEVTLSGKITIFEGRSNYQITVEKVEIMGIGALMELIEKRRIKLLNEGLFDAKHKKSLPKFPKIIGVITSPTGAVIEDIKHRITDRFPTHLLVYPAAVQGKNAANEIILGIEYFNQLNQELRPDVIIIARGGGSFEDLLPFNDEELIRAVFKSDIPIISAIGHETDNSLIDYVSDFRAPTPSAAAEIATPNLQDLNKLIKNLENNLITHCANHLELKKNYLENLTKYLIHPRDFLKELEKSYQEFFVRIKNTIQINLINKNQRLIAASNLLIKPNFDYYQLHLKSLINNMNNSLTKLINQKQEGVNLATKLLESYHYQKVLNRGYTIIRDLNDNLITSSLTLQDNSQINIEFADGRIDAIIRKS